MSEEKYPFIELKKYIDSITDVSEMEANSKNKKVCILDDLKIDLDDSELSDNDEENCDDIFTSPIEKLDKTNIYPISQYQAFQIANERQNLKSDFCKNTFKQITYLYFSNCKIKLLTYNNEKYWKIKITDGEISWVEFNEDDKSEFPNQTFCDGNLIKEDFKKLQCLVNVETGEYIYFPKL